MHRVSQSAYLVPSLLITCAGAGAAIGAPPFPAEFELSSLNGTNGYVINGIDSLDFSGRSVSSAGDVNGDGFDDILIGAFSAGPPVNPGAGETYIVFGGPGIGASGSISLSLLNGTNGFTISGAVFFDGSGSAVSSAGDVNGDGIDDLLIGASSAAIGTTSSVGRAYVVFGAPTIGASGTIELSALNGTNGFSLGGTLVNDGVGCSVAPAGDVNDDGIDDILVGGFGRDPGSRSSAGQTFVVFGGPTLGTSAFRYVSSLNGTNGFAINGVDANDESGRSVASAGDVNGDGIDDILIGAHRADPNGQSAAGETYVVFGKNTSVAGLFAASIELSALNGTTGFVINGTIAGDQSGRSVASAGDVNGDGVADIFIGATGIEPTGIPDSGGGYIVFGAPGIGASGSLNLATLNGTTGFVLAGLQVSSGAGISVSGATDINGDGIADIIMGAPYAHPDGGRARAGRTYVVFGGPAVGASGLVTLSSLSGTDGFTLNGIDANDMSGFSVSAAGDFNGDGISDLLIGAWGAAPSGQSYAGETYVVFGCAAAPACAGDVNGDGLTNAADFVILAGNFGGAVAPNTGGDLNGDGVVNAADFVILAGDFGCGAP